MKKVDELIIKANDIDTYCFMNFENVKQAKGYAHKIYEKLEKEEMKLLEEQKKLADKICELRLAESKAYNYYLNIK